MYFIHEIYCPVCKVGLNPKPYSVKPEDYGLDKVLEILEGEWVKKQVGNMVYTVLLPAPEFWEEQTFCNHKVEYVFIM